MVCESALVATNMSCYLVCLDVLLRSRERHEDADKDLVWVQVDLAVAKEELTDTHRARPWWYKRFSEQ